jgi:CPA1 family monovalent cation:H+ antiporter
LKDDGAVEREVQNARVEMFRATVAVLTQLPSGDISEALKHRYTVVLTRAEAALASGTSAEALVDELREKKMLEDADAVRAATRAGRERIVAMRAQGIIGDAAFQRVEQELDFEEVSLEMVQRSAE